MKCISKFVILLVVFNMFLVMIVFNMLGGGLCKKTYSFVNKL